MARTYRRNKDWLIAAHCGRLADDNQSRQSLVRSRLEKSIRLVFNFDDDQYRYGGNTPKECYRRRVNRFVSDVPRILYYGEGIRTIVVNQLATRYNRQKCRLALRRVRDVEGGELADFKQAPKQVAWKLFAWY